MIHLCFHGIGTCTVEREPGESRYWVTRDAYLGMLDLVVGRPEVRISFDDGNRSDLDIGLEGLRERGLHATFFALAGRLDDPASLGSADLRLLRTAGMAIGSHGWSHIPLRGLSPEDERRELDDARTTLREASDGPVDELAFPLGRYDRQLLRRLRGRDYDHVYSSDRFPARSASWLQPRFSLTSNTTVADVKRLLEHPWRGSAVRNLAASWAKRAR
jgi:peptidoglycan/xylan/chitin deacetylase (PgdA/CDA1 family)